MTEQCILYSALDAYVRHYEVTVPRDAVAHIHQNLADAALEMIERNMGGVIAPRGRLPRLRRRGPLESTVARHACADRFEKARTTSHP